ncbi:hypothetical protein GGH13_003459 [Coemansia sp. S155-1]|nr:hypothetical protein GGH13_003459 [Coemansia sp. S155-1]
MSTRSFIQTVPFRKLPKHVLETICIYVMRGGTNAASSNQSSDRADLIYSLCPEWTLVALEHCFSTIELTLDTVATGFCTSHLYSQMCVHMDKLCHITKTVNISMCLYDLVSGRAAQMLAQSPFSSLVFEAVRRVRINFDKESDLASFPTHFDVNARIYGTYSAQMC